MESIDITSDRLREKGYLLKKEGVTIAFYVDKHGSSHRFSLYKTDWNKTTRQLEKKLADLGFEQIIISDTLGAMSDNYDKIMNGAAEAKNNTLVSEVTETPMGKLANMTLEGWQAELSAKYQKLQETIENSAMPLPMLKSPLEFALSIKSILNIADNTLPFAGFLLAVPSSLKTVTVELFRRYWRSYFTHYFSPQSIVSHSTSVSEEVLVEKVDMLPRMKDRFVLTPELAPIFMAKEEDLQRIIAILTAILDGHGYQSNSGAYGSRGYNGDYNFMWLGAVVDIPRHVYTKLGNLGPKLHFLRLPRTFRSEKDLIEQTRTGRFKSDLAKVEAALFDYLKWFEACPSMKERNGIAVMEWNRETDEYKAVQYIARLANLLSHLRAAVDTWDTHGTQGSDYAYSLPKIEEPDRANQQLYNLARGHALSQGRNYITIDDIPLIIKVVLSTAPLERVVVFQYLISRPDGKLATGDLVIHMHMSPPTARRTMTELEATGLVGGERDGPYDNSPKQIVLKKEFLWCTKRRFRQLRGDFSVGRSPRNNASFDKRNLNLGDSVEEDSTKQKENLPPHPHISLFWDTFHLLEKEKLTVTTEGTVRESILKERLIASGKFTAGEAVQTIRDTIAIGKLTRLEFDILKPVMVEEYTITKR
jgi:hypothetical protein